MRKVELHCLIVGATFRDYPGLVNDLRQVDAHTDFNQITHNDVELKQSLKRLQGASLIFVPELLFSSSNRQKNQHSSPKDALRAFADLIWQYASDAIIVILDKKPSNKPFATYLNDVQISRLHYYSHTEAKSDDKNDLKNKATKLQLQFLAQTALLKYDFRCCKRLLGVSEKRTQRLVDSSVIPVAYISNDLHLHANTAYLSLFGLDSANALRSISVKDFISKQEHKNFDGFIRSQLKRSKGTQSLFLQMQKKNGVQFRANIRVIPSVYRSKRCLQLWVNSLDTQIKPQTEVEKLWDEPLADEQPQPLLDKKTASSYLGSGVVRGSEKQTASSRAQTSNTINPALILKEIVNRKEAQIVTHALLDLNKTTSPHNPHYFASLKVPYAQRDAVDGLLTKASYDEIKTLRSLFWDKVKLTRIFQILNKRKSKNIRLLVRVSEATLKNKAQMIWLQKCFVKLGSKSAVIVFMLPSRLDESSQKITVQFINTFKSYGCQFAFDDFFVNSQSLSLLKHSQPYALRLYLPWLQKIEGNQQREFDLARLIRQLESKNIRIIVPCGFSQEMNKLFILSGASFCQEKRNKNA